jgi:hypothetical protein
VRAAQLAAAKVKSEGPRLDQTQVSASPERSREEPAKAASKDSGAWTRFAMPDPAATVASSAAAAASIPAAAGVDAASPNVAAAVSGFSLAPIWPEAERDRVRQAEAMLAAGDAVNAILACDVLVTRVLASAAGLVGTLDAPRDPALVTVLLGLDGPRYLHFRTVVRAARHREAVTMRDAFECFTFSIEARRSREALRRQQPREA